MMMNTRELDMDGPGHTIHLRAIHFATQDHTDTTSTEQTPE